MNVMSSFTETTEKRDFSYHLNTLRTATNHDCTNILQKLPLPRLFCGVTTTHFINSTDMTSRSQGHESNNTVGRVDGRLEASTANTCDTALLSLIVPNST